MITPELQRGITDVRRKYDTWVLGSIKRTYEATKNQEEGSTPLAAFILISCAIDFLAGFYCGIESFQPRNSSQNYKDFVTRYLPQYDPTDVYNHIRCRLAHNYSLGGDVALTHQNPERHDPNGTRGQRIINYGFVANFQAAANSYFNELATDATLQHNFTKRLALGFAEATES